jgi:hypothetical protein
LTIKTVSRTAATVPLSEKKGTEKEVKGRRTGIRNEEMKEGGTQKRKNESVKVKLKERNA